MTSRQDLSRMKSGTTLLTLELSHVSKPGTREGQTRYTAEQQQGTGRTGKAGRRGREKWGTRSGRRIQAAPTGLGPRRTEKPSPPPGPQALKDFSKPEPILFEANPESKLHHSETLQILN